MLTYLLAYSCRDRLQQTPARNLLTCLLDCLLAHFFLQGCLQQTLAKKLLTCLLNSLSPSNLSGHDLNLSATQHLAALHTHGPRHPCLLFAQVSKLLAGICCRQPLQEKVSKYVRKQLSKQASKQFSCKGLLQATPARKSKQVSK